MRWDGSGIWEGFIPGIEQGTTYKYKIQSNNGGIITEKDPVMSRFKDGAFRVAIEKQIPVVPVTIPFNWIILPPSQFLLHRHVMKLIFHEPVDTKGLTLDDVATLREKVFRIIEEELKIQLKV